eukprot:GAHX01000119.1.p1 GENE.GAHX01000119.1~~GAHX01000119.1.p1  ORF type:complete len:183 (-),score=33.95 GAHX01000119.1:37-585(-)
MATADEVKDLIKQIDYGRAMMFISIFFALGLSCVGAAIGTAKTAIGFFALAVAKPQNMSKFMTLILMPGIVGLYGMIASVIILSSSKLKLAENHYDVSKLVGLNEEVLKKVIVTNMVSGVGKLATGAALGISCLAAGWALGVIGETSLRALIKNARLFTMSVVVMVFGEVIGLYALILTIIA